MFREERSAGASASVSARIGLLAPDCAGITSQNTWINLNAALRTSILTGY